MRVHTRQPPAEQFVLVEEAARSLSLNSKVLRQGIACGLVPIRRDNTGTIRVHLDEIPDDLDRKISTADIQPDLQAAALADEVLSLEERVAQAAAQRSRLEELIQKQGATLARYAARLDMNQADFDAPLEALASTREVLSERDAEVRELSNLLERTFRAMEARERQVAEQTDQLASATDKAMNLLTRALREGELSAEQIQRLKQQIAASTDINDRLEQELDQRNSVIANQQGLMERMVTLAERTPSSPSTKRARQLSFWQRLWGGGKGI